ncbi:MAG: flavin reductase [Alphaproteobacteria bacterium]|nr:flavin reductase [Alphaproteobacteria bacterium]
MVIRAGRARVGSRNEESRRSMGCDTRIEPQAAAPSATDDVALRETFIGAMRRTVSGVCVVTTDGVAGRFALTVSAVTPVSADPPILLVCINRRSPAYGAIRANGRFCANVLASDQSPIAETFAGRPRDGLPFDFACAEWRPGALDLPALVGASARFACEVAEEADGATHAVLFGRVCSAEAGDAEPLAYAHRAYARTVPIAPVNPQETR